MHEVSFMLLPARCQAGELARASGRMALKAYERTAEVNERYQLSERVRDTRRLIDLHIVSLLARLIVATQSIMF